MRSYNDIKRVEIEVDVEGLKIKKMSLFVNSDTYGAFEDEITSSNRDVHIQKTSDVLSISVNDKTIAVLAI